MTIPLFRVLCNLSACGLLPSRLRRATSLKREARGLCSIWKREEPSLIRFIGKSAFIIEEIIFMPPQAAKGAGFRAFCRLVFDHSALARYRKVTISPLVQVASGLKVVGEVPLVIAVFRAQTTGTA